MAICRALIGSPEVVLADEPTGNLDPKSAREVLSLLLETSQENDASLIVVTHDHSLLGRFDRIIDLAELEETS